TEVFHEKLNNDLLFRNEYNREKDIIQGIKNFRKGQLKEQLQGINISLTRIRLFNSLKIAGGISTAALIGLSTYFFTQNSQKPSIDNKLVLELPLEQNQESKTEEDIPIPPAANKENPAENIAPENPNIDQLVKVKSEKQPPLSSLKESNLAENSFDVQLPEVPDQFDLEDESYISGESQIDAHNSNFATERVMRKIETIKDVRYKFHYQLQGEKLFLYGDFGKSVYEIIEIKATTNNRLYLYYEGNFYWLKEDQRKVKPLKMIKNEKTIEKLLDIRKNKNL
ncbi:hypothetical protein, partial [Xanthovirga aplysinae]|uniref:hypothetical protein n=1 Tax=Xanthovirga aplysinae TaxID=2529853 RepID=UPI001656921D